MPIAIPRSRATRDVYSLSGAFTGSVNGTGARATSLCPSGRRAERQAGRRQAWIRTRFRRRTPIRTRSTHCYAYKWQAGRLPPPLGRTSPQRTATDQVAATEDPERGHRHRHRHGHSKTSLALLRFRFLMVVPPSWSMLRNSCLPESVRAGTRPHRRLGCGRSPRCAFAPLRGFLSSSSTLPRCARSGRGFASGARCPPRRSRAAGARDRTNRGFP